MISGTFVLTDKINAAFTDIYETGAKNVDVSVTRPQAFKAMSGEGGVPFDVSVVRKIERVRGVRQAAAVVESSGFLVNGSKKLVAQGGAPSILSSVEPAAISPYTAIDGELPSRSGEVAVNEKLAGDERLHVGQQLKLSTATGLHPVTISGIAKFGEVSSIGGATIVLAPLGDVQRWSNLAGKASRIDIAGEEGVSDSVLVQRVREVVSHHLLVETGAANAASRASDVADGLGFMKYMLLAFGFVAVFVGAFIIFNTYSITVAQRTREFGVLRTLGATGRQTLLAVLGEALIVGVIATALGIVGGVGFASLLTWIFDRAGFGIPSVATVIKPRTIVWAVAVGIGVTQVAALLPALRAKAVSPLAALRDGVAARKTRRWIRILLAAVFLVLAVAMIGYGAASNGALQPRLITLAVGALLFLLGAAVAMTYLVRPLVAVLGLVVSRLGGEGKLATGNTTRNPARTAVTAAALMIGTGLVVFVAILGSGLKTSITDSIDRSMHGDYMVKPETQGTPLPTDVVTKLRGVPGMHTVSPVGTVMVRLGKSTQTYLAGIDPGTFGEVYSFDWVQGSDALVDELGRSGALVERGIADSAHVHVGDRVRVQTQAGGAATLTVRGTYDDPMILNGVLVSDQALRPLLPPGTTGVDLVFAKAAETADTTAVERRVESALERFPVASVQSNAEVKKQVASDTNQMLAIFYALLAMSVIISLFGIVNTLVLSVYERTREIGVLRAVGTSRPQLRRMIRYESVMTSVFGALVGVAVGVVFGYATTNALAGEGLAFALPGGQIAVFMLLAVVAGILAAILPARRAAGLDVLRALQHE
jgi:putative ABC transport system permease protein